MNAQQMLEHLEDFFSVSIERKMYALVTPDEQLPLYKQFLYSDKKFRENTKVPVEIIGEEPLPLGNSSMQEAKQELQQTINAFLNILQTSQANRPCTPCLGYSSLPAVFLTALKQIILPGTLLLQKTLHPHTQPRRHCCRFFYYSHIPGHIA